MDKVTQGNAANAEETAAAAQELSAQAATMDGMVGELTKLVDGAGRQTASQGTAKPKGQERQHRLLSSPDF